MSKTLEERAAECGIQRQFFDATGKLRETSNQTIVHLANAIEEQKEGSVSKPLLFLSLDKPYDDATVSLPFAPADGSDLQAHG